MQRKCLWFFPSWYSVIVRRCVSPIRWLGSFAATAIAWRRQCAVSNTLGRNAFLCGFDRRNQRRSAGCEHLSASGPGLPRFV